MSISRPTSCRPLSVSADLQIRLLEHAIPPSAVEPLLVCIIHN